MKLTTIAVAALLTSAATDDAAIESRTEYKILCAYKSIVVPIDRGPKLSACKQDLAKIPAADLDAEREKFWLYWNSSQEAVAVSVVSKYATFRENARSVLRGSADLIEMTTSEIADLSNDELCDEYAEDNVNRARTAAELARRKLLSPKDLKLASTGTVAIGMTELAVRCAMGKPDDINRSVGNWGVHSQLVYGNGVYVYTENGKVTSWQD